MMHNLPTQSTPFIGRVDEITEISGLLADPTCRLLTLVGPGGIGKTRLALEAATTKLGDFANGIYFVPLQPVRSIEFLVSAIADAVKFPLSGREDPSVQLLGYLHDKEMLLVLDNFEHLLSEQGAELLLAGLNVAPDLKILVTSREVLNLQGEWLYPIQGLPFPESGHTGDFEAYSAMQLFVERAHRVRRDFSLAEEQAGVVRICQLVEGMPLAIELAASWLKTLRCAEISAEIQRNLDFLTTSLRDVPERHRSMQAVFDQSWKLLTEVERDVFKRLSVFRGGFGREAAKQVAGATLQILSVLVDKCLLRLEADGRYRVHELLRQYAEEQLQASPGEVAQVYDAHCVYYTDFLYQGRDEIDSGNQPGTASKVQAELENVRAARRWAVEHARVEEMQKSSHTLLGFYQFQCRYLEAIDAFGEAINGLELEKPGELRDLTLAEILVYQGWFYIRLGRFEEAKAALEQAHSLLSEHEKPPPPRMATDPLTPLAILAVIRGDYAEATALGEQARQMSERHADIQNLAFAYYGLTSAFLAQGNYEAAYQCAQQACTTATKANNRWILSYGLNEWGNVARALGDYAEAKQHYQASYAIQKDFNNPEGMAVALNHLGEIAVLQEEYREAQQLYQQSYTIYRDINDKGGLANALNGLGKTAFVLGEYQMAQQHLRQALEIATEIQFLPLTFSILIGIGNLLLHTESQERGLELLALAQHHPASGQETKALAQERLSVYEAKLPSDLFARATQQGRHSNVEAIAAALLVELAEAKTYPALVDQAQTVTPATGHRSPQADQPLIDPLTPRELEVLRLIADGLSNPEIAKELIIAVGTVKAVTHSIYSKLGTNNRVRATARARELNLL